MSALKFEEDVVVLGHHAEVVDCAWHQECDSDKDDLPGSYLITCSTDQTTRIVSQWRCSNNDNNNKNKNDHDFDKDHLLGDGTYQEVSRPLVHGKKFFYSSLSLSPCLLSLTPRVIYKIGYNKGFNLTAVSSLSGVIFFIS